MTHAYPSHDTYDSVTEARVHALGGFGFTQRQREFLVTVMVHAGCFLERQYCAFTGTVRGQNSREFMTRLVARGFARAIEPGPVRRGRLYHVHHKPLYEAIGQEDNRNRRLRMIARMVERVMILDAVLGDRRRCWWLSPADDKWRFFCLKRDNYLRPEDYPHLAFGSGRQRTIRCFPDKLPIGIEKDRTSQLVFVYLVNRRLPVDFSAIPVSSCQPAPLRDHVDGSAARATPVPQGRGALQGRHSRGALDAAEPKRQQGAGDVLSRAPSTGRAPRRSRRSLHQRRVPDAGDAEDPGLYRAWRREGDRVLWGAHSTTLRDARLHGCSAIEVEVLNRQYLQLTGRMDRDTWAKRGAKRKSRQVGPPVSTRSPDSLSPLAADEREPQATA